MSFAIIESLGAFESCKSLIEKHFPQSAVGGSKYGSNSAFDQWALATLAKADSDLKNGVPLAEMLQHIADSRKSFDSAQGKADTKAGVIRADDSDYYPGVLGSKRDVSLVDENNSPERIALMHTLAAMMEKREAPIEKDSLGALWQNRYTTRDGRKIPSSKAGKDDWPVRREDGDFPGENIHYDAADGSNMRMILSDSLLRLEEVRKNGASLKTEEEFLRAAYGYFTAMPYYKGSASIGRVLFTSIAKEVFKKDFINPDMDAYALALNEDQFIAFFRAELFGRN